MYTCVCQSDSTTPLHVRGWLLVHNVHVCTSQLYSGSGPMLTVVFHGLEIKETGFATCTN